MEPKALTYATIDLNNLKANHGTVRKLVGDNIKIMSIVKADGYGHGAVNVSNALMDAGTDCFGVANIQEAIELKEGLRSDTDIYLLGGAEKQSYPEIIKHGFIPVIFDIDSLRSLDGEAKKACVKAKVHLKFDTSMGRLGFFPSSCENAFKEAVKLENIIIDGIMSHFSCADEEDPSYSKSQLSSFDDIIKKGEALGVNAARKHIANSAGIINIKNSYYDMVRPGIVLYGSTPSSGMREKIPLKPVMSIFSRIIQIKEFPPGKSVSYSRTFTTKRKSKIAVLPIGYADGYPRILSNKGRVMLGGKVAPVVGNVTMDLTMIDVTDIDNVNVGDKVTVLGNGIDAWDLAGFAKTISYEIFTGISNRVTRIY